MVDFLRKAGMIISVIDPIPARGAKSKSDENVTSLSQVVKVNSATVKAKKTSEITNATIVNLSANLIWRNIMKFYISVIFRKFTGPSKDFVSIIFCKFTV